MTIGEAGRGWTSNLFKMYYWYYTYSASTIRAYTTIISCILITFKNHFYVNHITVSILETNYVIFLGFARFSIWTDKAKAFCAYQLDMRSISKCRTYNMFQNEHCQCFDWFFGVVAFSRHKCFEKKVEADAEAVAEATTSLSIRHLHCVWWSWGRSWRRSRTWSWRGESRAQATCDNLKLMLMLQL